jgi:hypothetical protein
MESCNKKGITLIYIPYWWDFKEESLAATIRKVQLLIIVNNFNSRYDSIDPTFQKFLSMSIVKRFKCFPSQNQADEIVGNKMDEIDHILQCHMVSFKEIDLSFTMASLCLSQYLAASVGLFT